MKQIFEPIWLILQAEDFETVLAKDGEEAIALFEKKKLTWSFWI